MSHTNRARRSRFWRAVLFAAITICLICTFALSGSDASAYRHFGAASDRWQVNPEFRSACVDYSVYGSECIRTHICLVSAQQILLTLRSIPGLPKEYAIDANSRQHYQDFSQGPLSAYLHLCSEQDVKDMAGMFAAAGGKSPPDDADLLGVLNGFHMDFPVVTDIGARRSVADLLRDTDAGRGFTIQEDIGPRLLEPIAHIAGELHLPTDPAQMTADQQQAVFERLDSYVHASDPELWRTKQVNDFCNGVWAQVYGPAYKGVTTPILRVQRASEMALILLISLGAILAMKRKPAIEAQPAEEVVV
jgi:hypothetical protein